MLVAPLDWGLGHATRCIPIIHALLAHNYEVILAAEGPQASLLRQEFPQLTCLPLRGYRVRYSKTRSGLALALLLQVPRLLYTIGREKRWLKKIIADNRIDLVISDNRYGLVSKKRPCVFITHQLTIKVPNQWLENVLQRINYRYINRFAACWVPDAGANFNVAGILSHPVRLPKTPVHYLGLLARFERKELVKEYDYCILLSGPEPQRSLLEQKILCGLVDIPGKILLVRGLPGSREVLYLPDNIEVKNHLHTTALEQALVQSEYIVSRSGYTTIMELLSLQKKSILIPTPGQTEQEYLAERLQQAGICFSVSQEEFDCVKHLNMVKTLHYTLTELPVFRSDDIKLLINAISQ